MTRNSVPVEKWTNIGDSVTSPVDQKTRKTIILDRPYVVVGFEVNNSKAFLDNIQDLAIDYGHAFFYIVNNNVITHSFSFGPYFQGKVGWFNRGTQANKYNRGALLKDGMKNSRGATPDYDITETVRAFRIFISHDQLLRLVSETIKIRSEVLSGEVRYTAYVNDTCAETAKEILDEAGIDTPNGSGPIKHSGLLNFPISYAVNPYKWHQAFKKSEYPEKIFRPSPPNTWIPPINQGDPIFCD